MSLTTSAVYASLMGARTSGGLPFLGLNFDRLALGTAQGVVQWGVSQPQNLLLGGAASGPPGNGVINPFTTRLFVPPAVGVLTAALAGAGMVGPLAQPLATAITTGITTAIITAAQYLGTAVGVSNGADVTKVVLANPASLIGIFMMTLRATLGSGPALNQMAVGLGNGIAGLFMLGVGAGVVTGMPSPPATSGVGVTTSVVV